MNAEQSWDASRRDREDVGLAHTLLFLFRCKARVTQRFRERNKPGAPVLAFLACLAAGSSAGCFTDPINHAPMVSSIDNVGDVLRGKMATFMAQGMDPDQDQLTWTWGKAADKCPDSANTGNWPQSIMPGDSGSPMTYDVPSSLTSGPFCVWAFATDRYGAVGVRNQNFAPLNNPPIAIIRVLTPTPSDSYPAYSAFELSAEDSNDPDGDPLSYAWSLDQRAPQSMADFVACPGSSSVGDDDLHRCLQADTSGQYIVGLTVGDGVTTSHTSMTLMVLADRPPWIYATTPDFRTTPSHGDPTDPAPVLVTQVNDDGDPYPDPTAPLQTVHFTWYKGKNDDGLQYVDNDSPRLVLSASDYQIGDVANVRLEITDRQTAAIAAILKACRDADFCADPQDATHFIRVTWRVVMDL